MRKISRRLQEFGKKLFGVQRVKTNLSRQWSSCAAGDGDQELDLCPIPAYGHTTTVGKTRVYILFFLTKYRFTNSVYSEWSSMLKLLFVKLTENPFSLKLLNIKQAKLETHISGSRHCRILVKVYCIKSLKAIKRLVGTVLAIFGSTYTCNI